MRANLVGALLFVAVAGCTPNNKELLDEAAKLESRACACKEASCTDGVVTDLKVWFDKNKERWGNQSDLNEIERRFTAMGTCMAKVGMSEKSQDILMKIGAEAEKL